MRRFSMFLSLSLIASAACCFCLQDSARPPDNDVLQMLAAPELSLPGLESEDSPYFSKQVIRRQSGREEILRFRSDGSAAHLFYGSNGRLRKVEAYRFENEAARLVYEGLYDSNGRRLVQASYYAADGLLESRLERHADGSELRCVYREGKLSSQSQVRSDLLASEASVAAASMQELFHWDSAKKQPRLRVYLSGSELSHWDYFNRDGSLAHSVRSLADRSLEFSYFEKGQLRRRQVWSFIGEDWQRPYYALSDSVVFAEGSTIVEHHVTLRSNGQLLSHERFNAKSGLREMRRDFDGEGRVERIEEFDASGQSKQVLSFPASSPRQRGFVPDRMRAYPGEEEKSESIYQLDAVPFQHSVLQRQSWSFFRAAQLK